MGTTQSKEQPKEQKFFLESPYDIENFIQSVSIASTEDKEMLFIDKFIHALRKNADIDIVDLNYNILLEMNLFKL